VERSAWEAPVEAEAEAGTAKPALPPELPEFGDDRHQRVRRGLVGQVLEFGPGDPQPRAAPPALPLRDAQQHPM